MAYISKFTAALPAFGLALHLSASPASAQTTTLDVLYAQPSFAKYHEPIAKSFMAKNPNIAISFRAPAANYDEGHQTMMRQSITNQLPDLYIPGFHLLAELTTALTKRGQILELGPLFEAEPAEWRQANYSEKIVDLGRVNGKLYGLPVNASLPIMYFNTELVKKAGGDPQRMPDTWDGIIALAAKIRETSLGVAGIGYNVHDWPDDWLFRAIIHQGGGNMLDSSGAKVAFNSESGRKAMRNLRRFVTEGGMPLIDFDSSRAQFTAGQIGIHFDTPARLRVISDQIGTKFTLGTEVFPIDDKVGGGIPTGGSAIVITTKDPAKQKAAWEYAKFLTGPEAQKVVVEVTGYLPTNRLAASPNYLGPFYEANPNFRTAGRQTDRAVPWQGYPGGNSVRVWRQQRETINAVMRGEIAPESGLEKIAQDTTALMK
jgi:multiple sugar transport system substrate-binding protein